jgi:glycosyltransferase involved in cell wall biosynthesis
MAQQPAFDGADLSIVVPAFNEEKGLGTTLDGVTAAFPAAEVIVVDDCSQDGTSAIAQRRAGICVLRHPFNRGQGAALKTGMRRATRPWVAWFDADNEHRTEDLRRLAARAQGENLVAVIGQRPPTSSSPTRRIGKWMIRLIGRGLRIKAGNDLNCGLRVFRREVILRYLPLIPDRFSASLTATLIMIERRYPIAFEPIDTNPRIGSSTVRLRDGFEAILMLIRAVLLFAPMRFFLPIGLWFVIVGTIYSLALAYFVGGGIPVAGMLAITIGFLAVILGLIADQISQLRLAQLPESRVIEGADDQKAKGL